MEAPRSNKAWSNCISPIAQEIRGVPGSFALGGSLLKMMELAWSDSMIGFPPLVHDLRLGVHMSFRNHAQAGIW